MKNLCFCNNCETVLEDENPQTGAREYPDFILSKEMVRETDDDGEHWACPVCKTDAYLNDDVPTFFVSLEYCNTGYVDSLGEFVGKKTQENTIAQISQTSKLLRYLKDCGEIKFFLWDNKEEMEQAADDGHDCHEPDFSGTWEELTSPYVAKLVTCSLMCRVVVKNGATEEEIIEAARAKFSEKIQSELGDNIETIEDDEECPFGTFDGDLLNQ